MRSSAPANLSAPFRDGSRPSDRYQQFGLNVVYYRKKKRLSQTQLAELVDIHRTYISAIEPGKVGVSFDVLFRLSDALEVSTKQLFEFRE